MIAEPQADATTRTREPWGQRLWLTLVAVIIATACLASYGISTWPMADDEVPSLVEMGLFHVDASEFSVPASQIGRLPRAMPVWYGSQREVLKRLPFSEVSFRLPALVYAILTSALVFVLAARWRGLWYATALALIVNLSPMFLFISQINRFYSLPLLLLTLTLAAMWTPGKDLVKLLVIAVLVALAVLSHNLIVVFFVLGFVAAVISYLIGRAPKTLVFRTGTAALVAVTIYVVYVRPIILGWASTGNPTPVLQSFAAHAGIPMLALAIPGGWLALTRIGRDDFTFWCALVFAGSLCFMQVAQTISWNPRYFLFFMVAMWVLAAHAMEFIARRVGYRSVGIAWYGCVVVLLLPGLLSHYQDGSRHDYRRAAAVLMTHARPGQPILSDDAETISFYLPDDLRQTLAVRTKVRELPRAEFFLVTRANAWTPLPRFPHRQSELLAEIYRRRFDQFSHILRVYRVSAAD